MNPAARGWLCAAVVSLLLGCESAPKGQRTVLAGSVAQNLLILPLNVAVVMPSELTSTSHVVWEELGDYLGEEGRELKTVAFEAARQLWIASVREVRAENAESGYDEASRALVRRLAAHAEFDTVVAPSLFVQEARISGRTAQWDQVERPVRFEGGGARADRALADQVEMNGAAPAASLHAVVLDAEGNKIQESQAGLELLVFVRVEQNAGGEPIFEFDARPDLFENREHVREGIEKALSPFLLPAATK